MKKFFKDHLFQLIYLIPVSFIAIGSFVLNIYLNQFGIIDVALFDSKTIFVGFIAVFQLICFFFFWAMFILKFTGSGKFIFLIINCFYKSILFSVFIDAFLCNTVTSSSSEPHPVFVIFLVVGISQTYFMLESNSENSQWSTGKIVDKLIFIFQLLVSISSIIVLIYFLEKDKTLSELFKVYLYVSIFLSAFLLIKWVREKNKTENNNDISKFNKNGKFGKLDFAFALLYVILVIMVFLLTYSKHVFPCITNNLGGGYYKYNTLIFEDDSSIVGKIIHSNSEYIYLIEEEDKLSQYPIAKIKAYEITKNNDVAEEEIIEKEIEVIENEHLPEE